jgi:hypothetical protein
MHIIFEFPIVDCRPLLPDEDGKLTNPEWPTPPDSAKSFIRHFGAVKERNAGGSTDWTGEAYYCNTHLALQYDDLHKKGYPLSTGRQSAIYNSYRRFYSDGYFVGKIEAGFVDNTEKKGEAPGLENIKINLSDVLNHYADLPVKVDDKDFKLYKAGTALTKKYYGESTSKEKAALPQQQFVVAGELLIVLVFSANETFVLPETASLLEQVTLPDNKGSLKLHGYKLKHDGYALKVWLIETPAPVSSLSKPDKNILRNLRINLLRIHIEKETLRILLNKIKNKKIQLDNDSKEAQLADSYFKKTAERLFKKERYTLQQKNILDFALNSENSMSPDSFTSLEEGVYYFQDQFTRNNIQRLLNGMEKKMILFICASPKGKNPLDFGDEFKKIKDNLQKGADRYNFAIEIEPSVKKNEFLNLLTKYKPDYLHLSMHSSLTDGLYFEDDQKNQSPMSVAEFEGILELHNRLHHPKVIILSACNSQAHAAAVKPYCEYAVGTQTVFPASAGVIYADKFYATLFEDNSSHIPECHDAGRKAIEIFKPEFDPINDIPVFEIPILI